MLSNCCLRDCPVCPVLSVCLSVTLVYCGQMAGWIKMKLGMQVGLGPGHTVLHGTQLTFPISHHLYCGQTVGCIKMSHNMEAGLSPGDFVLDGDLAPSPKRRRSPPIFGPCLLCQTAAWIKMPLGTEVDLGPDDIALDGEQVAPLPKMGVAPSLIIGPCLLWPTAGWIKMALGVEVGLAPNQTAVVGTQLPSPKRGEAPSFGPSLLWSNA